MKRTIKLFSVGLSLVLCFSMLLTVAAKTNIPDATTDFYVNDFAGVFSVEEKNKLMDNAVKLADENDGIQVVVTTVKSLDGEAVEDYAYDMYNKYGIGKDDMGLLILLATEDREMRVEVGKSMEAYINDAKAGRFMDRYAIPHLKENKFNKGLISLQEALIAEIKDKVVAESTGSTSGSSKVDVDFSTVFGVLGVILFIGLVVFIIFAIIKKVKKRKQMIEELNNRIKILEENEKELIRAHERQVERFKSSIEDVKYEKEQLEVCLNNSQKELDVIKDRYGRAIKLYPDVDKAVDAMIEAEIIAKDKEAARVVNSLINSVVDYIPDKNLVNRLERVISKYDALTENQKQYVETNINKVRRIYDESVQLKRQYERQVEEERQRKLTEQRKEKANDITKQILGIIALVGIARANDLSRLRDAKRLYENLDRETQGFVDKSVISNLDSLISAAKRDKDREEEEERRRRQSYYSSHSGFGGSSNSFRGGGFGGFGGSSGGGGASRKF